MAELPTGTVTFLFSDLEGSTRLWEQHPEAMKAALAGHDEILRKAVESHAGCVVKTTGDGMHAAFATAHDAIGAAVAAQLALAAADTTIRLAVRMGIHTGPAEVRDGDYFGTEVNRAARLMSAGHGGQILVSLGTEELVHDMLPDDTTLRDLGEHRLRDLARADRVFQIDHPRLGREFPALHTLDSVPGNLPVQLTSFIGRDADVVALRKAMDESRIVTLTGVGGVGKTRLALQVAADLAPAFTDGAWVCELAPATDADTMVQVVATTLVVRSRAGMSIEDSVVDSLRAKRLLLVLDNCEHLLRAAARFAEHVLREADGVTILATSREGLGVPGEQIWPVRSLDVPERTDVGSIAGTEAVRLFVERAHAARPGFSVNAGNAEAVAEVCRRLDGIPLALELAAARVVALTPADIAARLDERFRLLTGGRRTGVERHQTLRGAVDWSFSLLAEPEQHLFMRLGVFSGTFDVAAAESVTAGGGIDALDVVELLAELVRKSMVIAEDWSDTMRYQLLETLRQYALEQLEEAGEADAWRRHHAEHYAARTEEIARGMRGPDEARWRDHLARELDNLRAAMTWGLDRSDEEAELSLRIVAALAYETTFNRSADVGGWAERAFGRAEHSESRARRTDVLVAAAYSAMARGDHEHARQRAVAALDRGVDGSGWAPELAYVVLGYSALVAGRHDDVARVMQEGLRALEASGTDEWNVLALRWTMTSFSAMLRDPGRAMTPRTRSAARGGSATRPASPTRCTPSGGRAGATTPIGRLRALRSPSASWRTPTTTCSTARCR